MKNDIFGTDQEGSTDLQPGMLAAIDELTQRILARYPTTSFRISRAQDDPSIIHVTAAVDLDDPDQVTDMIIDRLVELQVEERIPIYVIPIRSPERVLVEMKARDEGRGHWAMRTAPLARGS